MAQLSEGCMTAPAATTADYTPKGRYEKVGDLEFCTPPVLGSLIHHRPLISFRNRHHRR